MDKHHKAISKNKTDLQKMQSNHDVLLSKLDKSNPRKSLQYKKLCFKDVIYTVGETLLFRETENSTIVGKLVRIIPEGGNP